MLPDLGMGLVLAIGGLVVLVVALVGYVLAYLAFLRKAGPNEGALESTPSRGDCDP